MTRRQKRAKRTVSEDSSSASSASSANSSGGSGGASEASDAGDASASETAHEVSQPAPAALAGPATAQPRSPTAAETGPGGHSSDEEAAAGPHSASVAGIKRDLGLQRLIVDDDDSFDEEGDELVARTAQPKSKPAKPPGPAAVASPNEELRKELRCAMCLYTLYKPVVLSCGHSFCRLCLVTGAKKMRQEFFHRFQCPSCRKTVCNKCLKRCQVNVTLWSTILCLFPGLPANRDEAAEREEFERVWAELTERTTGRGQLSFSTRREDKVQLFRGATMFRTVVSDPEDPTMHLALALEHDPEPLPLCALQGKFDNRGHWDLHVGILELEEDELAEAGGFPAVVRSSQSESTVAMRRTSYAGALAIKLWLEFGESQPLALVGEATADLENGIAKLRIPLSRALDRFGRLKLDIKSEQYDGLRLVCELRSKPDRSSSSMNTAVFYPPTRQGLSGSDEEGIDLEDTDGEEEDEDLDRFEDDGFVVNESEEEDGSASGADGEDDTSDDEDAASARRRSRDRAVGPNSLGVRQSAALANDSPKQRKRDRPRILARGRDTRARSMSSVTDASRDSLMEELRKKPRRGKVSRNDSDSGSDLEDVSRHGVQAKRSGAASAGPGPGKRQRQRRVVEDDSDSEESEAEQSSGRSVPSAEESEDARGGAAKGNSKKSVSHQQRQAKSKSRTGSDARQPGPKSGKAQPGRSQRGERPNSNGTKVESRARNFQGARAKQAVQTNTGMEKRIARQKHHGAAVHEDASDSGQSHSESEAESDVVSKFAHDQILNLGGAEMIVSSDDDDSDGDW